MRVIHLIVLLVLLTPALGLAKEVKAQAVPANEPPAAAEEKNVPPDDPGPELKSISKNARLGAGIGDARLFGLGIVLGQPLGGTLKYFITSELAVQGMVAWWLFPHSGVVVGADVVYHVRDLAPRLEPVEVGAYFGVGVGAGFWNAQVYHDHLTPWPHRHRHDLTQLLVYMRPVIGAAVYLRETPVEGFVELTPTYSFSPDRDFGFSGAIGARYYF